jgi:hypothetical protein
MVRPNILFRLAKWQSVKIKTNPDNPAEKAFKQRYRFSFLEFNIPISRAVL